MQLATKFGSNAPILRSNTPLSDDQIREVAPSIFAGDKHDSRSDRYTYIPTIEILTKLRAEGFQPFMVCQTRVRVAAKREHTKHMLRLRHASQVASPETPEIILLNSHDGSSSYQMLAGYFRFVCQNGLVFGDTTHDIRVPHKGDVVDHVVDGAHEVLDGFDLIRECKSEMEAAQLDEGEQQAFARSVLALRYDVTEAPAPITEDQLLRARRTEDNRPDLWTTFQRVQENVIKGGVRGRSATGRRMSTRGVTGIDQDLRLNRAMWVLAEEMRKLKG
ncbi:MULTISPECIES: DUF932 domain-containing protein [Burkholderia]|jgi:hypothetical protein|uniref:DUF932 domain-containing protein n=4 Tax=Burkholderia cepacia complex TaxID=87882 RepID=A0A2S5DMQ0_9BURK|nr:MULTISPECIES: DUF932 domain-containing protein [Burkholderia]EKS9799704.1 DUF945 domain-containing protein [Burkholderia cepacia]EKS9806753.1 DUF945 domain-containing protein [Burkholderia cepacia]EKS9814222.1 DUF945 domain-containing protein [Burkholderia cepacia]EKS9821366.1 DUF945 domain-containing protein [Burkholderia cepacia]EKS9828959.1 DUF945 domain-containing protein [Burkholderia cepacia]